MSFGIVVFFVIAYFPYSNHDAQLSTSKKAFLFNFIRLQNLEALQEEAP